MWTILAIALFLYGGIAIILYFMLSPNSWYVLEFYKRMKPFLDKVATVKYGKPLSELQGYQQQEIMDLITTGVRVRLSVFWIFHIRLLLRKVF